VGHVVTKGHVLIKHLVNNARKYVFLQPILLNIKTVTTTPGVLSGGDAQCACVCVCVCVCVWEADAGESLDDSRETHALPVPWIFILFIFISVLWTSAPGSRCLNATEEPRRVWRTRALSWRARCPFSCACSHSSEVSVTRVRALLWNALALALEMSLSDVLLCVELCLLRWQDYSKHYDLFVCLTGCFWVRHVINLQLNYIKDVIVFIFLFFTKLASFLRSVIKMMCTLMRWRQLLKI